MLPQTAGQAPRTILLVDDEPDILGSLQSLVQTLLPHVRVVTAQGAAEARPLIGPDKFDLILSDYRMPRTDGLQLLREAKRLAPHTRTALLTALAEDQPLQDPANAAFVDALVPKTLPPREFIARLQQILDGHGKASG